METQVMAKKNAGFTLIELMIVIQIISIMAAIALPNMMRLRIQSNQASAIGNLAAVIKAQTAFDTLKAAYPDDPVLCVYGKRVEQLLTTPPEDWDGVYTFTTK